MDIAELRRWVDTRELMRRDRGNHRLKLDMLDELPTTVMKQVKYKGMYCYLKSLPTLVLLFFSTVHFKPTTERCLCFLHQVHWI